MRGENPDSIKQSTFYAGTGKQITNRSPADTDESQFIRDNPRLILACMPASPTTPGAQA
ncbi:hypothetical protein PS623_02465 [Pseudomonas fluorescens]|jgi:hypothetical protein|nr:hypothetical protein PS623_02465 [Pseudomonas fluorescens]